MSFLLAGNATLLFNGVVQRLTTKTIARANGRFKVTIFRRSDGTFGFEHWKCGARERSWVLSGNFSECRVENAADAEREARVRVDWLTDHK